MTMEKLTFYITHQEQVNEKKKQQKKPNEPHTKNSSTIQHDHHISKKCAAAYFPCHFVLEISSLWFILQQKTRLSVCRWKFAFSENSFPFIHIFAWQHVAIPAGVPGWKLLDAPGRQHFSLYLSMLVLVFPSWWFLICLAMRPPSPHVLTKLLLVSFPPQTRPHLFRSHPSIHLPFI